METRTDPPVSAPPPGTVARAIAWSKAQIESASAWAVGARESHASVDAGFRLADTDKRVAAGVLAGGVAYRLFFWLISLTLLNTGALGLLNGSWVEEKLRTLGVSPVIVNMVGDASQQTNGADWWLLIVGIWLVLWTGYMCAKALVLVHATIWAVPPPRIRNPLAASLLFSAVALGFIAAMTAVRWLRTENPRLGLIATLALIALPFAIWLAASLWLPHRELTWVQLLPGAVLFAAGVQALHIFTTLFLGPKLNNATEVYGALGIATTALFWLYIVGRLVIGGATLNASLHEQRTAEANDIGPVD